MLALKCCITWTAYEEKILAFQICLKYDALSIALRQLLITSHRPIKFKATQIQVR